MKKLLVTITLCITATTSLAMELEKPKETKPNILAEITCIKNPRYAQYLANNHVVIAGENGCSIVDTKTGTEVKKISDISNQKITVHPNKKLFALFYDNHIDIYDVEKNDYIWHKQVEGSLPDCEQPYDRIDSIKFNPHDTSIFLVRAHFQSYTDGQNCCIPRNYNITECNYITHQDNKSAFGYNGRTPIIGINPTHHETCIIHPHCVTFHSTDHTTDTGFLPQTRSAATYGKKYKDFCEYNPNGSYMVQGDCSNNIYIINSRNINKHEILTSLYGNFNHMLFYSNSVIALSSELTTFHKGWVTIKEVNSVLSYWDIHTKELIYTNTQLKQSETHDFSFSPNKTKVIIALKDKCVILPVPFKVICKDITEETFLYLLFLLKNYTSQCDAIEMPQDVNHIVGNFVLELYKRQ